MHSSLICGYQLWCNTDGKMSNWYHNKFRRKEKLLKEKNLRSCISYRKSGSGHKNQSTSLNSSTEAKTKSSSKGNSTNKNTFLSVLCKQTRKIPKKPNTRISRRQQIIPNESLVSQSPLLRISGLRTAKKYLMIERFKFRKRSLDFLKLLFRNIIF